MEIEIRVRRPWWKKSSTWLLLAAICAAGFAWAKRSQIEREGVLFYRREILPRVPALKFLAKKAYHHSQEFSREVLPEKVEAPPLPDQPPATTLAAPDASPRGTGSQETSLTWVERGKLREKRKLQAGPRTLGSSEEARDLERLKAKVAVGNSIPLDEGQRPSMEGTRITDELPFYKTLTGQGVLLFLGIAAFFGLLAYGLLGVRRKWYKGTR